jgi:hypothetical protein
MQPLRTEEPHSAEISGQYWALWGLQIGIAAYR